LTPIMVYIASLCVVIGSPFVLPYTFISFSNALKGKNTIEVMSKIESR